MASILDPSIPLKINKMKERVCWQHPDLVNRGIDQTRLILEDGGTEDREFSFLVIGDSGSGPHIDHHPQRRVAEQMLPHLQNCRFLLHTGDVVYQVGSREQYPRNFIYPYREWLMGGEDPERIGFDSMVFRFPFLPVPGNHDYYNLPWLYSLLVQLTKPLAKLSGRHLDPNVGWHGSRVGDAYARAFLDYLKAIPTASLGHHLERHYGPWRDGRGGLRYQPGEFTRLPNHYYTFRYGGIDFFALDSNTLNDPAALVEDSRSRGKSLRLREQRRQIYQERQLVLSEINHLSLAHPHSRERLDDLQATLEQIDEVLLDLDKQIHSRSGKTTDIEQMVWLRDSLIASWGDPSVRGRILYFHHPAYVTEATKWNQGQTLAMRRNLRWVLDQVVAAVPQIGPTESPVNLVFNGHAHCFEYLRTVDTGHGDRHIHWLVCGGSGLSLRRQRSEGGELEERVSTSDLDHPQDWKLVAHSELFVGLSGYHRERRRPYSFLKIDVKGGASPKFVVTPYISERYKGQWQEYCLDAISIG